MIAGHPERSQSTRPVLIDTDPGIDDALALFLAWGSPGLSVETITTVAGNVSVERATANAARLLGAAHPARRPRVARGAAARSSPRGMSTATTGSAIWMGWQTRPVARVILSHRSSSSRSTPPTSSWRPWTDSVTS
jgi:inosine-uridine nucleoside N-ribohydrolase